MRVLFLDDDEQRHDTAARNLKGHVVHHVRTVKQFEAALSTGPFDVIYLDHDLGGEHYVESGPGTGYEAAHALARQDYERERRPRVIVHSYNRPGALRMINVLMERGFNVVWLPFGPNTGKLHP